LVLRRKPEKPADEDKDTVNEASILKIEDRLDAFDRRLDNIDSMVTAVAERVMSRPLVITATCPHCGKSMEIALIGTQALRR
jgi:hypothetical protein